MDNIWYDLSKGILQEGQKEFVGEAIAPAPPLAAGVPGQRKLKRFLVQNFLFDRVLLSVCVLDTLGTRTAFTVTPPSLD